MVTDFSQKRVVINMQLRQCFARAKPFRLLSKKSQRFSKKPEFQNRASKKAKLANLDNSQITYRSWITSMLHHNFLTQLLEGDRMRWEHRCRSRQIFVPRIFAQISPNLPEKIQRK